MSKHLNYQFYEWYKNRIFRLLTWFNYIDYIANRQTQTRLIVLSIIKEVSMYCAIESAISFILIDSAPWVRRKRLPVLVKTQISPL